MKIAVPLEGDLVAEHFGHAPQFAIYEITGDGVRKEIHLPPPHEPGVIPRWLSSLGVTHILCGQMGMRALMFFEEFGIRAITGVPPAPADEVVGEFLAGRLRVEPRVCGGHGEHRCGHGGGCSHR
ncbi:MAG: dinitrogenase iron-molybdenum cofactor [Thermodesulfobacteria bacterium]|nr:dinitrogenase iron-molybdenum cofactor [Thermodesulfobacteriota bacterium]